MNGTVRELDGFSKAEEGAGRIKVVQSRCMTHSPLRTLVLADIHHRYAAPFGDTLCAHCRGRSAIWQSPEMWLPLRIMPGTRLGL